MEKILLAVNAVNPDKNAMDFSCYPAKLTKSKVTGVFPENFAEEEKAVVKKLHGPSMVEWEVDEDSARHKEKLLLIEKNITAFKEGCISREVNYDIYRDAGVPAKELLDESRIADVMIIDSEISFEEKNEGALTGFVKDMLEKAECPVIIAPETFDGVNEIIMTCNASASSVYAIKLFTYLFTQLNSKKVTVLQANETGSWEESEKIKFSSWLKNYYTSIHFEAVKGSGSAALFNYLYKRKNTFIVMGAYGRSTLSRFLKESHADLLIKTITQPLFIAHQ
ncbi:MAG: universal stress protein [Chitinophagaceae bacterium]|nr:universal stress protein [Chitinophagaceae bacterium]